MTGSDYEVLRELLAQRRLPAVICDLERFDANASRLAERAAGLPIRVASKSLRCRALMRRALDRPGYAGLMCYSAGEAAFLASSGFDDLMVAYPTWEREELVAAARATAEGRRIALTVDCVEHVDLLESVGAEVGVELEVSIEIDMSWVLPGVRVGVHRSPVRNASQARQLARAIERRRHLRLVGVMGYEAQVAGLADNVPGMLAENMLVSALKSGSIRDFIARRQEIVEALRRDGFELRFVNGGGTGSIEVTHSDSSVTEVAAGSGLYGPHLFDNYKGFDVEPAVAFALRVIRRVSPGIYACHGGGFVASGDVGRDRLPQPWLPDGMSFIARHGPGEVETPIRYDSDLRIGTPVLFRAAKAGELCERFPSVLLIEKGRIVNEVPTYRGDGKAFH